MNENIKENIAKFLQCNTVNLYACIQDKDNVISYREIRLWNTAIEVFTQHFSAVLQKMYLSECKLISIDELFSTGLYQARKLRKMYLNSYMRELHGIVNLDEIKETVGIFDKKDSDKIHALIIEYRINNDKMWLYQRYSVNKTLAASKYLWFFAKEDVFDVQKKLPDIYISTKIDALIINGSLLSDNIDILERDFGLNEFTQRRAQDVLHKKIKNMHMLIGEEKLDKAIEDGDLQLCRQIVKSGNNLVWEIDTGELVSKVKQIQAEKNLYTDLSITEDDKFDIRSRKAQKSFLKLINDEILTSVITGIAYDAHGAKTILQ